MKNVLNFFKKTSFVTFLTLGVLSCSFKPIITSSGNLNLDKKIDLILPGTTNKNDVVRLLGETLLKEEPNNNKWAYIETIEKKTFGKKKIIKNTLLILDFDSRGILITKKILNKNKFKKIAFDNSETKSFGLDNSFSKRIFSSVRKRAQNAISK
tara:strand:- start:26 stop:487 length:462 start_codon:yes stop_codon:yes gene_type:complete